MRKRKTCCRSLIVWGNAYEAGKQLGELLKEETDWVSLAGHCDFGDEILKKYRSLYEEFCPGIMEEMQGFADALKIDAEAVRKVFFHRMKNQRDSNPEWGKSVVFIESRIDGQYVQYGLASCVFGRLDGVNEHGLCVETSVRAASASGKEEIQFPVAVRAVLSRCRTVEEAVELLDKMPLAKGRSFGLVDRQGSEAVVEAADAQCCVIKEKEMLDNNCMIGMQRMLMKRICKEM